MHNLLIAAVEINDMWYALPLIVAISLVYAATRHEEPLPILAHAVRVGLWITGAFGAIMGVIMLIEWQLKL